MAAITRTALLGGAAAAAALTVFFRRLRVLSREEHTLEGDAQARAGADGHWALGQHRMLRNRQGLLIATQCHRAEGKSGRAPTVAFLVHGFMEHSGRYQHVIKELTQLGISVYTLDLQGHGQSQGERAYVRRFDDYATDVLQYVTSVSLPKGTKRILIGHSMGGLVCAMAASKSPDLFQGLVLLGAWLDLDAANKAKWPWISPVVRLLSRLLPKLVIDPGVPADRICSDPTVVAHYLNDPLVCNGAGVRARLLAEVVCAQQMLRREKYGRLSVPMLVLHGLSDTLTNPKGSQDLYDQAPSIDKTLKLFPGQRHELLNEPIKDANGKNPAVSAMKKWLRSRL